MKVVLMNLVMICHENNRDVLVLDKIKKEGWEGLTYPGGHIEQGESFFESAIREVKEETNLNVSQLRFVGIVQWHFPDQRQVGFLYRTNTYEGTLIQDHSEGKLMWMDYNEFIQSDGKSLSMDDILSIYHGRYKEIIFYFDAKGSLIKVDRHE